MITDKDIFNAAKENSEAYQKELAEDGVEDVAAWKEISFFEQGARWMRDRQREDDIAKACRWLRENMEIHKTAFALTDPPQAGHFINAEDAFVKIMREEQEI